MSNAHTISVQLRRYEHKTKMVQRILYRRRRVHIRNIFVQLALRKTKPIRMWAKLQALINKNAIYYYSTLVVEVANMAREYPNEKKNKTEGTIMYAHQKIHSTAILNTKKANPHNDNRETNAYVENKHDRQCRAGIDYFFIYL